MKKNKHTQTRFEKGLLFSPSWLEETKKTKNAWFESGFMEEVDTKLTDIKPLTSKQLSFEKGFLEEMNVTNMHFENEQCPSKRKIKLKHFDRTASDEETVLATDFFKAFTEIRTDDYNAIVVDYKISAQSSCICEIILAFQGESENYFFVKYVQTADTTTELLNQINDVFYCWDEHDSEHNLENLLGNTYHINVDKDSTTAPIKIF